MGRTSTKEEETTYILDTEDQLKKLQFDARRNMRDTGNLSLGEEVGFASLLEEESLHKAAFNNQHERVQELILNAGRAADDCENMARRTPLHFAALNGSEEACEMLLSVGNADCKVTDCDGERNVPFDELDCGGLKRFLALWGQSDFI